MFTSARGQVTASARHSSHALKSRILYTTPQHIRFFATKMTVPRHHFAPLVADTPGDETGLMRLQGVVFDMDGTLCESTVMSTVEG